MSSELEHLPHVQATLEAVGAVSFGPDEDVSGQPPFQLPDLARPRLPDEDVLAALEPDAERTDRRGSTRVSGASNFFVSPIWSPCSSARSTEVPR